MVAHTTGGPWDQCSMLEGKYDRFVSFLDFVLRKAVPPTLWAAMFVTASLCVASPKGGGASTFARTDSPAGNRREGNSIATGPVMGFFMR